MLKLPTQCLPHASSPHLSPIEVVLESIQDTLAARECALQPLLSQEACHVYTHRKHRQVEDEWEWDNERWCQSPPVPMQRVIYPAAEPGLHSNNRHELPRNAQSAQPLQHRAIAQCKSEHVPVGRHSSVRDEAF